MIILLLLQTALALSSEPERDRDQIYFPKNYSTQSEKKWPMIVLLHGFKVSGSFQKHYFGITQARINKKGFILYVPGSTRDKRGHRFWNAMDYCCDYFKTGVDDHAYLAHSIEKLIRTHAIDPNRVSLLGHSNGSFMSHRLLCENADLFASAVTLAGASLNNLSECRPSSPVALMVIHSKNDVRVPYEGMNPKTLARRLKWRKQIYPSGPDLSLMSYPGVKDVVAYWKEINSGFAPTVLWTTGNRRHTPLLLPGEKNKILDFLLEAVKIKGR